MPRVIAGAARGRRLAVPAAGTRPTSDRAREALFSALEAERGSWAGARFLDLYAGSGAVGLEALSRGAAWVLLVESERAAVRVMQQNVDQVGLPGVEVRREPVERLVAAPPDEAFDVVFLDPPYAVPDGALAAVLERLISHGWVTPEGLVVVERPTRGGVPPWPPGLRSQRSRRYGEATLWYGRAGDPPVASTGSRGGRRDDDSEE